MGFEGEDMINITTFNTLVNRIPTERISETEIESEINNDYLLRTKCLKSLSYYFQETQIDLCFVRYHKMRAIDFYQLKKVTINRFEFTQRNACFNATLDFVKVWTCNHHMNFNAFYHWTDWIKSTKSKTWQTNVTIKQNVTTIIQ